MGHYKLKWDNGIKKITLKRHWGIFITPCLVCNFENVDLNNWKLTYRAVELIFVRVCALNISKLERDQIAYFKKGNRCVFLNIRNINPKIRIQNLFDLRTLFDKLNIPLAPFSFLIKFKWKWCSRQLKKPLLCLKFYILQVQGKFFPNKDE